MWNRQSKYGGSNQLIGQSSMDNPENTGQHWKQKTQDNDKQNKKHNTT
jgi:hypothetical protein